MSEQKHYAASQPLLPPLGPTNKSDALKKIVKLADEWGANHLGGADLQRKRWQRMALIATAALADLDTAHSAGVPSEQGTPPQGTEKAAQIFSGIILGDSMDAEWGGFDGCDIEDAAIKAGLLIQVPVTESCGEDCRCAEYGFPTVCNTLTDAGNAVIQALPTPPSGETT